MQKTKSSRAAVRNTPQHKAHIYIPAVFVDDYGRDCALSAQSAKSFSKKKLDAASRSLERRSDRAADRAIAQGDRETAQAIRRLRAEERKADRERAWFFRRLMRTKVRLQEEIKHKSPKAERSIWPSKSIALPKYDGPILDSLNRRGVFFRARYYSSRTAKPGVSKRVTIYIFNGSSLDADGHPMVRTNVGASIEETVCGLDHLEQVNRSAQKNAKVLNHAVLAMDYRWTPDQMLEVGERWAQERFGQYGLPFVAALHEPPPDGDARNWHIHVVWSWRPLERVGDHEWMVGESLRTEFDGAKGMWLLRERFASAMTEMSYETGRTDIYTAHSYAARGLPVEPQVHLDEGRTRRARAGEFVEANEENHERVLRSKAALVDDELRREDKRLARKQDVERQIAARFSQSFSVPLIPSIAAMVSKAAITLHKVHLHGLAVADTVIANTGLNPPKRRASEVRQQPKWTDDLFGETLLQKFANLRISWTVSVMPHPEIQARPVSFRPLRTIVAGALAKSIDDPMGLPESKSVITKGTPPSPQYGPAIATGVEPIASPSARSGVVSTYWTIVQQTLFPAIANIAKFPKLNPEGRFGSAAFTVPERNFIDSSFDLLSENSGVGHPKRPQRSSKLKLLPRIRHPVFSKATNVGTSLAPIGILQPHTIAISPDLTTGRAPFRIIDSARFRQINATIANALSYLRMTSPAVTIPIDDEDDKKARPKSSSISASGSQPRIDFDAIYRRLAHAKAQLSKIPRDNLPARDGAWPDPAGDDSARGEAGTVKPIEAAEPEDRRPSEVPTDKAVNASLADSPFRRNARGQLVMRPLPDGPGGPEVRALVDSIGTASSTSRAAGSAPGRDQGKSQGFKVSEKIASAVKRANSAAAAPSPSRGLHPKIDLWLDADDRNDRGARLRMAASIDADPVAKAKVMELDKPTQVRLVRDWVANRSSRDLGSRDRDGRNVSDE